MSGRFALGPEVKRRAVAGGAMLYDTSRAGNLSNEWFEPRYWQSRGELQGAARGRGAAYFVKHDSKSWVLRHYRRGGLMAQLLADRYHWRNEESTRPFVEWQLTYRLHRAGLPVPAPVAARYHNRGSSYTGDIITERLPDGRLAHRMPARRRALDRHLDLDRPLHPPLPRPGGLSCRPQRAQCAAERGERLPHRL